MDIRTRIVIIGGGIAGISCLDTLLNEHRLIDTCSTSITLVSETRVIKKVINHTTRGRNLEIFDIETGDVGKFYSENPAEFLDFKFIVGNVVSIDSENQLIEIDSASIRAAHEDNRFSLGYDILCLANGSTPKSLDPGIVPQSEVLNRILTIRDTTSVNELTERLINAEKVAIIGNGGIALELVHKLIDCHISWVIRDEFVGHPYLDSAASKFLLESHSRDGSRYEFFSRNSETYGDAHDTIHKLNSGPALGPHWLNGMILRGSRKDPGILEIFDKAEVGQISFNSENQHKLRIIMRDSRAIDADLIILAIGVVPNQIRFKSGCPEICSRDGGILIDPEMRTSIKEIYAAGDVASCRRWPQDTLWSQMRSWTQARQMGHYCGKCISAHLIGEDPTIYANFECFTHVTSFFGFKIVLLGRYKEHQLLGTDNQKLEVIARVNRGKDYIKVVLEEDRVIGAILIGETGLEETIENLIHDQISIGDIKHQLLDDTIDIEDYFD